MRNHIATFSKVTLISLLSITIGSEVYAQQFFTYSQYMNNQTQINPAYSLLDKNASLNTVLRKQWAGIQNAPTTLTFNASLPIESINGSAGIIVMNDRFAIENLTEVNAFFAKSVRLSDKTFLGVSVNAGVRHYSANYSILDSTDPLFHDDVRQSEPNLGFGLILYTGRYYIGASVPELNVQSVNDASTKNNIYFKNHYNFSGAYLLDAGTNIMVKPAFLATYTKNTPVVADISTTIYLQNTIGLGADYRTTKEMAAIFSFIASTFRLGYSYQFGTTSTNIGGFRNATHEVTLSYRFGQHLSNNQLL